MSLLDPGLFDRRDPLAPYEMSLHEPLKAEHGALTSTFGLIIRSCQQVLGERSKAEINYALEFLNWLMEEAGGRHKVAARNQLRQGKEVVFETEPRKILTLFEDFELDDHENFPNAGPEDYFAVLALAKCYAAIEIHERIMAYESGQSDTLVNGFPPSLQESLYPTSVQARDDLISDGKDLVGFIDGIRFAQLRAKNAGRRGAQAKNTSFAKLNETLMARYDENYRRLSNRHAANRIYEAYQEEIDSVLRTDDPVQRIAIWIGRHKKAPQ